MDKVKVDKELDNNFEKHELFIELEQDGLSVYNFRQPNTSNGFMKIIITSSNVIITGDYGDAIYGYFSTPSYGLGWLAGLNIGYFNGKCEASEVGRNFKEWDFNKAYENLQYYFLSYFGQEKYDKLLDCYEDLLDEKDLKDFNDDEKERFYHLINEDSLEDEIKEWDNLSEKEKLEFSVTEFNNLDSWIEWNELKDNLHNEHEWVTFINTNTDLIETVFGYDYWEFLYNLGQTIAYRCRIHLDGIKRAHNCYCDMLKNETLSK